MRATRILLFCLLGAVLVGSAVLIITSYSGRGATNTFRLVPTRSASSTDLGTDAAALVRRFGQLGYRDTQASVSGQTVVLIVYGNPAQTRRALDQLSAPAVLLARPVTCTAPPLTAASPVTAPSAALSCAPSFVLSKEALKVDTKTGKATAKIEQDPVFVAVRSTEPGDDLPSDPVLLPTGPRSGFVGERLVLGPAGVTNSDISSVQATQTGSGWALDVTLTSDGSKSFDDLAYAQFHAYVAIDIDGTVVSNLLVEPTESSFGSFNGTFRFGSGYTRSEAIDLANDLAAPLAVPLRIAPS
jgi:hypothetical protein